MNKIEELEKKIKDHNIDQEKYRPNFEKYATYMGNAVYQWLGLYSSDTRELFLMGVLHKNNIGLY